MRDMVIRELKNSEHAACERILRSLPDWFGIEESLRHYVADTQRYPTWVAGGDGDVIGFVTLREHFPESGEIHCLAVGPDHHRTGIGRSLVLFVEDVLRQRGAAFMQVKTLGPSRPDEFYARTLTFYRALGFTPLEEFHCLWPENPCLLLVKAIDRRG